MCKCDVENVDNNDVDDNRDAVVDVYDSDDGDIDHINLDDEQPSNEPKKTTFFFVFSPSVDEI